MDKAESFYQDVYSWLVNQASSKSGPLVVGVNGPQGCGKTTLGKALVQFAIQDNKKMISLSVDDFYLTHHQQKLLAHTHQSNPYWKQRGYPGTHDLELGKTVLAELKAGRDVSLPRYDKSAFSGSGDRKPKDEWDSVQASEIDVILFDGWMLGFTPLSDEEFVDRVEHYQSLTRPFEQLEERSIRSLKSINDCLVQYFAWTDLLDGFLHLKSSKSSWVLDWRVEAEENMKAEGKKGMSREQVKAYAKLFLPAYELWGKTIVPQKFSFSKTVEIGKDRLPLRD